MKNRNLWLLFTLLILASLMLAQCAPATSEPTEAPEVETEEVVVEEADTGDVVELRMTWYTDGNEDVVMRELLDRFEAENPDIKVVMDTVAYQSILENLPIQLAAGEGPDMARVTDLGGLSKYYLDLSPYLNDPAYWEENFGSTLPWLRPTGDDSGIYGFQTQLTITGPFINRTLFEQAGVTVPSDSSDEVTWEEWATAANEVAQALDVPFPMAMDRTGHRFAGPAISQGAVFFDENGYPFIDGDPGFKDFAQMFVGWHEDGTMPIDVWAGATEYAAPNEEFINGQMVLYMSGSWQVGQFTEKIGDAFDWEAVPNPCGPAACTGMPGGAALVALKDTQHPEEVARVMEFLSSEEILSEFSAKTLFIPAHLGLSEKGVPFETDLAQAKKTLDVFVSQVGKLSPIAIDLQAYPYNRIVFDQIRDRLTQVLVGELTLDEGIARIQEDIDAALAEEGVTKPEAEAKPTTGEAVELRMIWYTDGNEDIVMQEMLNRFEAENPDIKVVLDTVAYNSILEILPTQLAAGESPDMARVTDLGGLSKYYLDLSPYLNDPAYWEENFGSTLPWLRPTEDDSGIYGFQTQLTITGPFINRTLFEQAGVAVPSDSSDEVTWEEWATAANEVAQALDVPFPMAMDRTGHRFAGPAISQGAVFFDENGYPFIDGDPGFKDFAQMFVGWHEDGTMPIDVWAGATEYAAPNEEFINGQMVLYMSGSWQVGQFTEKIGDAFDWEAVPNPCGPAACTGMPGGAALVALKDTQHPEEVARVMEFLSSEEILSEFSAKTLFIPAHLGLSEKGVPFETDLPQAKKTLDVFVSQVGKLSPIAIDLQAYPYNRIIFDATRNRLTQVLVGELTLDEGIARIQEDIDAALAEEGITK
jgi:alpha-1,4-digalacturonate transport system substrate-binding protein